MAQTVQILRDYTGAAPPSLLPGVLWGELGAHTKLYIGSPTGNRLLLSNDPADPAAAGITAVNAGHGLNGGGTSGVITIALNVPVAIADGGTNAATPSAALANLGGAPLNSPNFTGIPTIGGVPIATTAYVNANLGNYLPLTGGSLSGPGNLAMGSVLTTGNGVSTGDAAIELGGARTGIGNAYIDFHAQAGSDFDFRIIRAAGASNDVSLVQSGPGNINLNANHTVVYRAGVDDPLYVEADPGHSARFMSLVNGQRLWSTGTIYDGTYAIADETGAVQRLHFDTAGNLTLTANTTITGAGAVDNGLTVFNGFHVASGASTVDGGLTVNNGFHVTSGGQIDGDLSVLGGGNAIYAPNGNIVTNQSLFVNGCQVYNNAGYLYSVQYVRTPGLVVDGTCNLGDVVVSGWLYGNGSAGGVTVGNHLLPAADGGYFCGDAAFAWAGVESYFFYTASGAALKDDIAAIDGASCLKAVEALRPVTFRYKALPDTAHCGFVAEEVLDALQAAGIDSEGFVRRAGDRLSLDYQQLIPLLCAAVQDLSRRLPA